jgi:multiple sugar transport system permease protein
VLAAVVVVALAVWTVRSMSTETGDGRETIVFWGAQELGEDIYAVVNRFENLPENRDPKTGKPKYKVIVGTAVSPDLVGDAQRLLCAVAGGVPPDVVWFDRFAIGEWAARDALEDLVPYINAQPKDDPYRLNIDDFYQWAIAETSYRPPGSNAAPGVFGIPWGVDMRVLFCNADLLRQEGLVDPKTREPVAPKTWEEQRQYASALTRYARPGDKTSGITRLGFAPNFGNSWLYMFAWQAGGEFINKEPQDQALPDGSVKHWPAMTRVMLNSPPVGRALKYMTDVYDDLGGFARVDAFQQSFQLGAMDPFIQGSVAMKIDGMWALEGIADWKRNMDFIVSPAPIPADRLAAGAKPITWGGGFSLVMPKTARNKEGGWKLIQFLSSTPTRLLLEQGNRERRESEGRLYLPKTPGNRVLFEELIRLYVDGNPQVPPPFRRAYAVMKDMMPNTLYRPVTPVGQMLWLQHVRAYDDGVRHMDRAAAEASLRGNAAVTPDDVTAAECRIALARAQEPVQAMLDEYLTPLTAETRVNWTPYFWAYGLLVALPFAVLFVVYRARRREYGYRAGEVASALLFASPWIVGFVVLVGGPIFFSVLFAFTRYNVLAPAHWVGLDNFRQVFTDDLFLKSLGNTAFMVLRIPLTMAASLAIALLLNRGIRAVGFYRTACYMPAIVPLVASSLLWMWILNPEGGPINQSLRWLYETPPLQWIQAGISWAFHYPPDQPFRFGLPLWLQSQDWSKPSLILMSLWGAGGGIIIWLAGLQSIPPQLYEAAAIDGAGPWRRFWNVTVPMLSPYILFNFIIGVIGTMQIFNESFVMTQGGPANSTLFYAYHLFRQAFQYFRMGYASALAWILFVVVMALTLLQLWLSTKWVHYERT